jgi:LacI family transcriptional regulator
MKIQSISNYPERITIRHVAHDAGVSVAAVSKVLRQAYGVSEQLRLKVEASIEKLNYRPSFAARGMRGSTYTIGILVIELSNPFLPGVIESVIRRMSEQGYKSLVGVGHSMDQIEASMIESMIDNRMDGVVVIAPRILGTSLDIFAQQIPIVAIAHHEHQDSSYDTVNSDDRKGAALAVEALIARGYRDIAMLGYDISATRATDVALQREAGYMDAMKAADLENLARIERLPPPGLDRIAPLTKLLSSSNRPRAMFVWSDLDAIVLLGVCQSLDIKVPEDLAVIGYDNSPPAAIPLIGLSSVDQNPLELGEAAADLLLSRIGGRRKTDHALIKPKVVVRKSI